MTIVYSLKYIITENFDLIFFEENKMMIKIL